jgi:hypothetical protein
MLERAFQYVRKDLHVAVRMLAEALGRGDTVIVDHEQVGKAILLRIVIVREGKCVPRAEPAMFCTATLIGLSDFEHLFLLWVVRSGPVVCPRSMNESVGQAG